MPDCGVPTGGKNRGRRAYDHCARRARDDVRSSGGDDGVTSAATTSVPPATNDDDRIRSALTAYAEAFSRLDVEGARRVYPQASADALRKAFQSLARQTLTIVPTDIARTGSAAEVTANVRQLVQAKAGAPQTSTRTNIFSMQRNSDGTWIITQIRVR